MQLIVDIKCIIDKWMKDWIKWFCSIWLNRHSLGTNSGPTTEVDIGYRVNKTNSALKKKRRENRQAHSRVRQKAGVSALPFLRQCGRNMGWNRGSGEEQHLEWKFSESHSTLELAPLPHPELAQATLPPRRNWQPIETDKMSKHLPSEYSKHCHLGGNSLNKRPDPCKCMRAGWHFSSFWGLCRHQRQLREQVSW